MTQVIPLVITVVLKKYWLLKLISINNNYDATTLHLIQISTAAEIPHGIGYGTFRSVRWIKNASPIGFDARFVTRSAPMFYLVGCLIIHVICVHAFQMPTLQLSAPQRNGLKRMDKITKRVHMNYAKGHCGFLRWNLNEICIFTVATAVPVIPYGHLPKNRRWQPNWINGEPCRFYVFCMIN